MRYNSTEEAQQDHIKNYRSDGVKKGKGTRYSPDFYRVNWITNSVPKNSYFLDAGCNAGTVSLELMTLGCFGKGIDIVQELVDNAKKHGLDAEQGSVEDLSRFKDEMFDVVICTEVLEHLYDPLLAIEEAYRVLKKGGKYIATVPHPDSEMSGKKLGDFHHINFDFNMLDELFHKVFEKGEVTVTEIPYTDEYCQEVGKKKGYLGWIGLVATKEALHD